MLGLCKQGVCFSSSVGRTLLGRLRALRDTFAVRLCSPGKAGLLSQCHTKSKAEGPEAGAPQPGKPWKPVKGRCKLYTRDGSNLGRAIWFLTNRSLKVSLINFRWCLGSVFTEKVEDAPHNPSVKSVRACSKAPQHLEPTRGPVTGS